VEETGWGTRQLALRPVGDQTFVRASTFIVPNVNVVSTTGPDVGGYHMGWHVPLNDTHSCRYAIDFGRHRPIDRHEHEHWLTTEIGPDYRTIRNRGNRSDSRASGPRPKVGARSRSSRSAKRSAGQPEHWQLRQATELIVPNLCTPATNTAKTGGSEKSMTASAHPPIRVGILGLGGAARAMVPKFARNPRFKIAAGADLDAEILARFKRDFPDAETWQTAEALCESRNVDLVYIGTPNRFHREHAVNALKAGKHALVEKPMAVSLEDAAAMVQAADASNTLLGVNVKHSFEPRIQALRKFTQNGDFGALRMMHHWRYQDWLYRPRTPEELTPEWGGGILWRQGGHQLDLLRTIGLGMMRSVRGSAQVWDASRRVPGVHSAYFEFESGAIGTCVYSGQDHYESSELVHGFKSGELIDPSVYAEARRDLRSHGNSVEWETAAARDERYGGDRREGGRVSTGGWILGGPLLVSYDHADVKLSSNGLMVYGDEKQWEIPMTGPEDGRDGRLNAFADAIETGRPLECDGRWGMATVEVLLAIEQSGRERREMFLEHQVAYPA